MKYNQYLLIKLAEEASEIAQAAIKCSLFGYNSKDPREIDGDSNLVKLQKELLDMSVILMELNKMELNNEENINDATFCTEDYMQAKLAKLEYYFRHTNEVNKD